MIQILFWIAIFLVLYTYLIYPFLLVQIAKYYQEDESSAEPFVSVIIPVYNEEILIKGKIESVLNSDYPLHKIEIIVYSDGSDDDTPNILKELAQQHPNLKYILNPERKGKSHGINILVEAAENPMIILTDANIFFDEQTIKQNVKKYTHAKIGLVASIVNNQTNLNKNIILQERNYVSWENKIKYHEGLIWGTTIAPFGACLSFRKELFEQLPDLLLVDDFFIASTILKKHFKCVVAKESVCYEELNDSYKIEFNRRIRISTGNFQNLKYFFGTFINVFKPQGFCFWSHKGLRWFTPFLLILIFVLNLFLYAEASEYKITLYLQFLFYCTPLTDYATRRIIKVNKLVKFANYFLIMNLALFIGFVNYLKGVNVGYWDTTLREK